MKRVLVTGPVDRRAEYVGAANAAHWTPIDFPIVEVVHRDTQPREVLSDEPDIDWICVTSSNAVMFVERVLREFPLLAQVSAAAVGERTTNELARVGCSIALEPSMNALELSERVLARSSKSARVLWPHGDRADELAHLLRSRGLTVIDPIVYETRSREDREIPPADVVFFASPSAVAVWHEHPVTEPAPRLAIAIGTTTLSALHAESEARFERLMVLPSPSPEAFGAALAHLDLDL